MLDMGILKVKQGHCLSQFYKCPTDSFVVCPSTFVCLFQALILHVCDKNHFYEIILVH